MKGLYRFESKAARHVEGSIRPSGREKHAHVHLGDEHCSQHKHHPVKSQQQRGRDKACEHGGAPQQQASEESAPQECGSKKMLAKCA
eukprot:7379628-Prymnesium_polylepis.4